MQGTDKRRRPHREEGATETGRETRKRLNKAGMNTHFKSDLTKKKGSERRLISFPVKETETRFWAGVFPILLCSPHASCMEASSVGSAAPVTGSS